MPGQPTARKSYLPRILFVFRDFKNFLKQNNQPPLSFHHFDRQSHFRAPVTKSALNAGRSAPVSLREVKTE